jgi:hypothetical protein
MPTDCFCFGHFEDKVLLFAQASLELNIPILCFSGPWQDTCHHTQLFLH